MQWMIVFPAAASRTASVMITMMLGLYNYCYRLVQKNKLIGPFATRTPVIANRSRVRSGAVDIGVKVIFKVISGGVIPQYAYDTADTSQLNSSLFRNGSRKAKRDIVSEYTQRE